MIAIKRKKEEEEFFLTTSLMLCVVIFITSVKVAAIHIDWCCLILRVLVVMLIHIDWFHGAVCVQKFVYCWFISCCIMITYL